jgi:hypothetical protein
LRDIVPTYVVNLEQNRRITKNTQAAQVQGTFPKVGASLTNDDDAFTENAFPFNPDPIRPTSDDTKVHNIPKVIEPCANAAQTGMPRDEASTMTRPKHDLPEVARNDTKDVCDPESDNLYSSSRQKSLEPTDKLPMADMASDKMIQYVKNEKRVYDMFYGSSATNMIGSMTQIHNIAKDGMAYESLLFITDDPADMMPSYHNFAETVPESNDPPLSVSRSKRDQGRQLEALTDGEESVNRQHEGVHDDLHQRFTLPNHEITCPMNATYETIAVGEKNYEVPQEEHDDHNQAKKIAPLDALFPKIRVPSDDENMHKITQRTRGTLL